MRRTTKKEKLHGFTQKNCPHLKMWLWINEKGANFQRCQACGFITYEKKQ